GMVDVRPIEHGQAALVPGLDHDFATRNWNERAVVRDSVLLPRLAGRQLVVLMELQLVDLDVEKRIGAPIHLVLTATLMLLDAAPAFPTSLPTARGRRCRSGRGAIARVRGVALGTARWHGEPLENTR